jgi:guanylate kinase
MDAWREYDYLVVNDEVDRAVARLIAILDAGHCAVRNVEWQP